MENTWHEQWHIKRSRSIEVSSFCFSSEDFTTESFRTLSICCFQLYGPLRHYWFSFLAASAKQCLIKLRCTNFHFLSMLSKTRWNIWGEKKEKVFIIFYVWAKVRLNGTQSRFVGVGLLDVSRKSNLISLLFFSRHNIMFHPFLQKPQWNRRGYLISSIE